ncbi:hypothetical protein [Caenimonas aquaedulcis]|uniref:Uncharacterized protein n=1 Tax=Caenimonas aquaedulcis TaxID=2793270 RepID=A0A931H2Q8_9BURK|nr:hypothetical protein [Caenimonas aquaedulcis]MBG9387487.1 hypothetical protein [Caenimonas aquaedulcis]
MNENRTTSILQRLPMILAVTAASYGLQAQAQTQAQRNVRTHESVSAKAAEGPSALERMREAVAAQD